jgi:hypothetical protein
MGVDCQSSTFEYTRLVASKPNSMQTKVAIKINIYTHGKQQPIVTKYFACYQKWRNPKIRLMGVEPNTNYTDFGAESTQR